MEEFDLKELFGFFVKKLWVLIIVCLFVTLLGVSYSSFLKKPMYKSDTSVILGATSDTTQSITTTDITINQNLVDTYTQVIKSRRILSEVIDNLSLDISYDELKNKVSVSALNGTEIIQITVVDYNSKHAMTIANEIADVFTKEIVDLYNVDNVSILDTASLSTTPYNINLVKEIIIYVIFGIVLSIGLIFVLYYFDRTIKSVEQIENRTKLPILGSVQEITKGGKF